MTGEVNAPLPARAAPDGLAVRVVPSAADIPVSLWRELNGPDDPLWSRSLFLSAERGGIGPDDWRYLVLERAGEVVAVLPTQTFASWDVADVLDHRSRRMLLLVRRLVPGLLRIRVLFAGNLLGQGRPLVRAGEDESAVLQRLAGALKELATAQGASWIVWKDLPADLVRGHDEPLTRSGFFSVPALPDTELALTTTSTEEFIAALPAKPRRNCRAKRRRLALGGACIACETDVDGTAEHLVELYTNVLNRAEERLDVLTPEFLRQLARADDMDVEVLVARRDDATVGFLLCLRAGRTAVALRVGLDYERARDIAAYHNLHYEAVDRAIQAGCERLQLLQTAYEAKRELGATRQALVHLVTHRRAVMRAVLAPLLPLALPRE